MPDGYKEDQMERRWVRSPPLLLALVLAAFAVPGIGGQGDLGGSSGWPGVVLLVWNIQGYAAGNKAEPGLVRDQLRQQSPNVLCLQELANDSTVDRFAQEQGPFSSIAFRDSCDGQDNAVFARSPTALLSIPGPAGFGHPPQVAFVWCEGFDAVVVSLHLCSTNAACRAYEKALLFPFILEILDSDPDLIVAGDFNMPWEEAVQFAQLLGLVALRPESAPPDAVDYIFLSPDLSNEEYVAGSCAFLPETREVSDHPALVARFRTDGGFRDRP